jgi:hypothetical protein
MSGPKCPNISGMRYLILFLAIPFLSAQAGAPDCERIKKIASDLEKKIQSAHFTTEVCTKMDAKSLGLTDSSIGFSGDWDYRCKDYSAIDAQLKSIENEIALLKGIESLKTEIIDGLKTIDKNKNQDQAKADSASFMKNLEVARSLEKFLATSNASGENILGKVATDPDWKTETDLNGFAKILMKYCGGFPQKESVCEKGYALNEDTFKEIKDFIKVGKNTERKFNKNQIKDLTNALAINSGEEKYSFEQLAQGLKGVQANGLLAAEDIQMIKALPELSNDKSFDFLKNMKQSIKGIKASEALVKAKSIPSHFSSLLNDLKKRQEWEMKSKLSLVLNQHESSLTEDVAEECTNARELKGSIEKCLTPLLDNKALKSYERRSVGDLISEFHYGQEHIAKLDQLLKECIPDEGLAYPAKCEGYITKQMAELVAKSQVLNALKAKHIQADPNLISLRNFALEKLNSESCKMTSVESNISSCDGVGNISLQVIVLSAEAKDIVFMYDKPTVPSSIEEICDNKEIKTNFKDELCAIKDEPPMIESKSTFDSYEAPVNPDGSDNTAQAWVDLGSSVVNSLAALMAPRQQPMMRPYAPVLPYSQPIMYQPKDIVDKTMDPFLAKGFGFYNFGSSNHFNSPVGW